MPGAWLGETPDDPAAVAAARAGTRPAQDDVAEAASHREQVLPDRFAAAFEDADVPALAALLRDDVVLEMPPWPAWFTGRGAVLTFVAEKILATSGRFRVRPARANGQPAFATYQREAGGRYRAHAVQVLSLAPGGIARPDILLDPGLFRVFGLPAEVGDPGAGGAAISAPAAGLSG